MNAIPQTQQTQQVQQSQHLEQLQTLTREYAKFSRSAAGWGIIIGGALGLALYAIISTQSNLSVWARVLCGLAPILWLTSKQLLQRRYYQRLGQVFETDPNPKWLTQVIQGGLLAILVCIIGIIVVASFIRPERILSVPAAQMIMLVIVCAYGLYATRQISNIAEMLVALHLYLNTFFVLLGLSKVPDSLWALPLCSGVLVVMGIYEHLQYKVIERQLKKFRNAS